MFSSRASFDLRRNRLAELLAEKGRRGEAVLDLTESNPTRCGFRHPRPEDLAPLADPAGLLYEPAPLGHARAREAVAGYYAERGETVPPGRILLTASTSEAYAFLFKLLADPGDEVLVPRPSYPLLDFLARLEGVSLRPYRLAYEGRWRIDLESVRAALGPRARALVTVSPNNPTGSAPTPEELAALDRAAGEAGVAVVSDEVFADFPLRDGARLPVAASLARSALTFSLSGLSKVCGLPQVKLAWVAAGGPADLVGPALERLEVVADTFLSVSTPVQLAAARLLAAGRPFREECRERVRANREALARRLARAPATALLEADGGWYACLRVPRLAGEEDLVLALLAEEGVAVHPGYFFDFPEEAYLVVSLIVPSPLLAEGLERVLRRVG